MEVTIETEPNNEKLAWKGGPGRHFRQREEPGKSEKRQGTDAEGTPSPCPYQTPLFCFKSRIL